MIVFLWERTNVAMEWFQWVFEGFGTEILSAAIGLVVGGIGGFVIGRVAKGKQIQKAGNEAKQQQEQIVENERSKGKKPAGSKSSIYQKQVAGDNAEQIQTGSVKNGR